jgi:hypothetical protein
MVRDQLSAVRLTALDEAFHSRLGDIGAQFGEVATTYKSMVGGGTPSCVFRAVGDQSVYSGVVFSKLPIKSLFSNKC